MAETLNSAGKAALPRGIWALGLVSLLMDTSSEMIHSLLPAFLTTVLGAGPLSVGIVEGIAEATAAVTKLFSGLLSDRVGRRKPLVLLGYGLAALSKPGFALAPTVGWVLTARVTDRLGKGIRDAPRDALVADLSPPAQRGAAFGLRQSLDTVGAFAGPLIAAAVMAFSGDSFRLVFWTAGIPALLCVLLLMIGVREPDGRHAAAADRPSWRELGGFPAAYWTILVISMLMTLARFSEGFLLLRAQGTGLALALVPLVLVAMNVVYAASAYPVGRLSDRIGRHGLLATGLAVLLVADLALAAGGGIWPVLAGVALWGLHLGLTQGLLSTLVADTAPAALRATAFGFFNLASGAVLLVASVLAGWLWASAGPAATFGAGAAFTAAALAALLVVRGRALGTGAG